MKTHAKRLICYVIAAFVLTGCAEEEDNQYREKRSPVIWGQRNVRQIRGQLLAGAEVTADDTNAPVLISDVSAATTYDMVSAALRGRGIAAIQLEKLFYNANSNHCEPLDLGGCVSGIGEVGRAG